MSHFWVVQHASGIYTRLILRAITAERKAIKRPFSVNSHYYILLRVQQGFSQSLSHIIVRNLAEKQTVIMPDFYIAASCTCAEKCREAQLCADKLSISLVPAIVTDGPPLSLHQELHMTFVLCSSTHQTWCFCTTVFEQSFYQSITQSPKQTCSYTQKHYSSYCM